jgi:hypothetical protein
VICPVSAGKLLLISSITKLLFSEESIKSVRGCVQNFPDWPPGARTANGTSLCN